MHDVMSAGQAGYIDYGFLGAAQIDAYGNLNTTVIGPHKRPKVRLPGSGGAADIGSFAWETIIIMNQDARRFVPKLDFLTTPGFLDGPSARSRAGLPEETGPYRVISQLGLYDFDEETKRMRLIAVHPGITVEEALAASGFEILVADEVAETVPPTEEQKRIMHELDPAGLILGR
jgi:acyl CoA:acetate/3-ketoacid CoA transferase beta subunit